jgi:hypothetical protein
MPATRFLLPSIAALGPMMAFAIPSGAGAADVNIYAYGPRPVYVAPPPRVYVRPAGVVTVSPRCVTRSVRVWVNGRYAYRTVRSCI